MSRKTTETPTQAELVIIALDQEQRQHYFGTKDRRRAIASLTAQREADQNGDHPAQTSEVHEAEQVATDAAPAARTLRTAVTTLFMLAGWGFLLMGGVGIVMGILDGARNPFTGRWQFTGAASVLVIASGACLALACLLWAVRATVEAGIERARERVLIQWAVGRPGQLGRGIPALRTDPGSGVVLVPPLRVVAGLLGIVGVFLAPVAGFAALIALVTMDWDFLLAMLGLTAGGLTSLVLAWLLWRATSALGGKDLGRRRALAGRFLDGPKADEEADGQG